jgi:hypothetical protein
MSDSQDALALSRLKKDNIVPLSPNPSDSNQPEQHVITCGQREPENDPKGDSDDLKVQGIFSLDILNRRLRMLKLFYSHNLTNIAIKRIAEALTSAYEREGIKKVVTAAALRRDWTRRSQWEPQVWAAVACKPDFEVILQSIHLVEAKCLGLMDGADGDNAKVGAGRVVLECKKFEVACYQSAGKLPRMDTVKVDLNVSESRAEGIRKLAEYAAILSEAAALSGNISNVRPGQYMDSSSPSPGNG